MWRCKGDLVKRELASQAVQYIEVVCTQMERMEDQLVKKIVRSDVQGEVEKNAMNRMDGWREKSAE